MIDKKFNINSRFSVDATLNLIKDRETGKEHRLEPRLINILCMLAEHEGELVRREQLISEIWSDYGGAEDSLNQAISFLRKALQDSKKELIETVPKKGYILHATISSGENVETGISEKLRSKFKYSGVFAVAIFALLLTGFFLLKYKTNGEGKTDSPQTDSHKATKTKETLEVNFSELNKPEEENSSNTITTTGPDGTKYRIVAMGDRRPKFYVNGQLISGSEIEKYSELEGQMLRQLWDRQGKSIDTLRSALPK